MSAENLSFETCHDGSTSHPFVTVFKDTTRGWCATYYNRTAHLMVVVVLRKRGALTQSARHAWACERSDSLRNDFLTGAPKGHSATASRTTSRSAAPASARPASFPGLFDALGD